MHDDRNMNGGFLAVVGGAILAFLVYGVASAGPPPSVKFAVAEALLLLSVLAMVVDLVVKSLKPH
jgi:hypothetical protein